MEADVSHQKWFYRINLEKYEKQQARASCWLKVIISALYLMLEYSQLFWLNSSTGNSLTYILYLHL